MKKLTLLLASALTILAGTIIAPAIPVIEKVLSPEKGLSLIVSFFVTITSLFIALAAPLSGWVADKWGRKKLLLGSLVIYACSGTSGLYLDTAVSILVSRMILGFSVSGIMTSSTTLIADYFSDDEREQFFGYQVAFMAIGGFFFLIGGGILASYSWRAPFGIYFVSLLLIPLVAMYIHEPEKIHIEKTEEIHDPIRWPLYFLIISSAMMGMMLYFLIPTRLPFYLDIYFNLPPQWMGFFMGTGAIFISFMATQYSSIHNWISKPLIYAFSFLTVGIGLELISQVERPLHVFASVAITGLGFGLNLPNSTVWVSEIAPSRYRGRMIGGLTSAVFLGQFFSTLFGEPLYRFNGLKGIAGVYGIGGIVALTIGVSYCIIYFFYRRRS